MSSIKKVYPAKPTREGAGVTVNRIFGYDDTDDFDPFLMLDYLLDNNGELKGGFPWHPHRGIETITYLINGHITHEDSMGNKASLRDGEVQWMTAGKGVLHQEMLGEDNDNGLQGFQFWLNMPAEKKMTKPNYIDISQDEMISVQESGLEVKVIAGDYKGVKGVIQKNDLGINMFHVSMSKDSFFEITRDPSKQGYIFVFEGNGLYNEAKIENINAYTTSGGKVKITTDYALEFIYAEGKKISEPIAWGGPIVMNTQEELKEAFDQLQKGEFL
jgi:redox-sensitive bicupin YhaK (pirin superfamily)